MFTYTDCIPMVVNMVQVSRRVKLGFEKNEAMDTHSRSPGYSHSLTHSHSLSLSSSLLCIPMVVNIVQDEE